MTTVAPFRYTNLTAKSESLTRETALLAFAAARGITSRTAFQEFISQAPAVPNPMGERPAYVAARDRLAAAIRSQEKIVFLGDYDTDGISSLTIMLDLAKAAGSTNHRCYIPERAVEDYGLTQLAADNCIAAHSPTLLFTVDCGSPSIDVVKNVRTRGIDVIILDHHGVPPLPAAGHPATAHLNPNDPNFGGEPFLATMSAGGLSFLFAECFAQDLKLPAWDRDRALIIAGLSTLVDVMPLVGINRSLVKNSLTRFANGPADTVPGLTALRHALSVDKISAYTYGFVIGPHLNAGGRLATAEDALRLLAARRHETAEKFIPSVRASNEARKQIQQEVQEAAFAQADAMMLVNPSRRIIVLGNRDWHPGVVGIVAGKIKEKHRRPVIVVGFNPHTGVFKGSGRSIDSIHLGQLIAKATKAGVIIGGGGHKMAVGLRLSEEQIPMLQEFCDRETADLPLDTSEHYEVLGDAEKLSFREWIDVFDRIEPTGNSNPKPYLLLESATLISEPEVKVRNSDQKPFGVKGVYKTSSGKRITAVWKNPERAKEVLRCGATYRLIVSVSANKGFENWDVVAADEVSDKASP